MNIDNKLISETIKKSKDAYFSLQCLQQAEFMFSQLNLSITFSIFIWKKLKFTSNKKNFNLF